MWESKDTDIFFKNVSFLETVHIVEAELGNDVGLIGAGTVVYSKSANRSGKS
jgi:hypothetical protein